LDNPITEISSHYEMTSQNSRVMAKRSQKKYFEIFFGEVSSPLL